MISSLPSTFCISFFRWWPV